MNPADPAGAAVLDAARAIAAGDLGGTRHARGPHPGRARRRRPRLPRAGRGDPAGRPPIAVGVHRSLVRDLDPPRRRCRPAELRAARRQRRRARPRCRRRRHGRAGPAATVALADRHAGRLRGRRQDQHRPRAPRGRGRGAARPGGRRHPPRHPCHDHAQRLRPRFVQRRPRGGPDGRCRQRRPADTRRRLPAWRRARSVPAHRLARRAGRSPTPRRCTRPRAASSIPPR